MCLFICVLRMMSFIPFHFCSRDSHALPRHVKIISLPPTPICSWHISGFASQRCISFKTSRMSFRCIQHRSLRPVRHHICILHSQCFVAFSSSTLSTHSRTLFCPWWSFGCWFSCGCCLLTIQGGLNTITEYQCLACNIWCISDIIPAELRIKLNNSSKRKKAEEYTAVMNE